MKNFIFLSIFLYSILIAKEPFININELKGDFLYNLDKQSISSGMIVTNDAVIKKVDKDILFADKYLKDISKEEVEKLKYDILQNLSVKQEKKIKQEFKNNITDDIAYSYYLVNKNHFFTQKRVDIFIFEFDKIEDAKAIKSLKDLPGSSKHKVYNNVLFDTMIPNYMLQIERLKPNELSDINKIKDKFMIFYYTIKHEKGLLSYNDSKKHIENILADKKYTEYLISLGKKDEN